MGPRIKVCVHARDPVSRAGVLAELRPRPEVDIVDDDIEAEVAVVVSDRLDEESERVIRALRRSADADAERLVRAIRASARGDGSIPPDLLGRLFNQIGRLQNQVLVPRGLTLAGVTEREVEVLRLVAEGLDTTEIASKLAYSERTIKNILHDVVARYGLRNRAHAVAYALREGLI
jgi:DNA-binding NarL/FixJ family response regulator